MRLQKVAALVIPLTFVACGGSTPTTPTSAGSPSTPPATSTALDVVTGTYLLTVAMSQRGEPTCDNSGICISISLCGGMTGPPPASVLTTLVRVDRSGDTIAIRPEDASASFRMDLRIAANTVSGPASGQFRDSNVQLSLIIGAGQAPAMATGSVLATSVAGKIDGQVGVGGYSCSNNGHTWTLVPR